MRARLATAASAAHRRRRYLRAAQAQSPCRARPNPPRPRRARSRARHRRAASEPPIGPPSGAPRALLQPLRRSRAVIGTRRPPGTPAARAVVQVACAERASPRQLAVAWSLGRVAAPSLWCPFRVLVADARLRPLGPHCGSDAASSGPGLAWGWWPVAPGPVGTARGRHRDRRDRRRA